MSHSSPTGQFEDTPGTMDWFEQPYTHLDGLEIHT